MKEKDDLFYQTQLYTGGKNLCPVVFVDEHFEPHPKYPRYLVSTYGRVYDTKTGCMKIPVLRRGYLNYCINTVPKHFSNIGAHRMTMQTFEPIENDKEMVVNHKDLNRLNNKIENLEWITQLENIDHAYKNGAFLVGEDRPEAKHTNAEVEKICMLLEKGYSYKEICKRMCYKDNIANRCFLASIKSHAIWKSISKKYNF